MGVFSCSRVELGVALGGRSSGFGIEKKGDMVNKIVASLRNGKAGYMAISRCWCPALSSERTSRHVGQGSVR